MQEKQSFWERGKLVFRREIPAWVVEQDHYF